MDEEYVHLRRTQASLVFEAIREGLALEYGDATPEVKDCVIVFRSPADEDEDRGIGLIAMAGDGPINRAGALTVLIAGLEALGVERIEVTFRDEEQEAV